MKYFTAKPLVTVLAIYAATVRGETQLTEDNAEVSFNEDTTGMPTDATIAYVSDLGTAATATAPDTLWVDVSTAIAGTGSAFYTGTPTITGSPTATDLVVDFGRDTGNDPSVGTYTVILKVLLYYENAGTDHLMDEVWYTFNVEVTGTEGTSTITTAGSTAGSFTYSEITDETAGSGSVESAFPASLVLVQTSTNDILGNSIVLQAKVTDAGDIANYNLWVVPTEPIWISIDEVYEQAADYEWPDIAVESTQALEATGVNSVDITLKSVPVSFFNAATAYVQLTVHYRDESNDARRRALRGLQDHLDEISELQDDDEVSELQDSSAEMVAKIEFDTDDSGAVTMSSLMIVSTTAMAGAALFI